MNTRQDGRVDLMASQPGGTYVTLLMSDQGQGQAPTQDGGGGGASQGQTEGQTEETKISADTERFVFNG